MLFKKNKTLKYTIVSIAICGLLIYLGFWAVYSFSMNEANEKGKQMSCQEQVKEEFKGQVVNINRYEYNSYMNKNLWGLEIKTEDTLKRSVSYQFKLENTKGLLKFVKTRQKVIKKQGNDKFSLTSASGVTKSFQVPDCRQ